nr:hypothetical protein [Pseudomonas sp. AU10]
DQDQKQEHGGLVADLSGRSKSRAKAQQKQICFSVGAGLSDRRTAAMQTPGSIRYTELMPSQASQLPH